MLVEKKWAKWTTLMVKKKTKKKRKTRKNTKKEARNFSQAL